MPNLAVVGLSLNLFFVFAIGAAVGSFLNVCAYRIPYERSFLWPGSHCGHCYQPVRWYDNLPLFSYWILRGRCRTCGSRFSIRYFLVELLTAFAFVGLYYVEIYCNVLGIRELDLPANRWGIEHGVPPRAAWIVFLYHATLLSFLIVTSLCDIDHLEIPLAVTVTGTVVGLIGAACFPWPYPNAHAVLPPQYPGGRIGLFPNLQPPGTGLYVWPVWYHLPPRLPIGSWQFGLATGLAGAVMGNVVLRAVRFLFGIGRGIEGLGIGDADLMMMAGSFVGWQVVLVAFAAGVLPALVFGVTQAIFRGKHAMPFGPSLAMGVLISLLCWRWIGPRVWPPLSEPVMLLFFGTVCPILLLTIAFFLRLIHGASSLDEFEEAALKQNKQASPADDLAEIDANIKGGPEVTDAGTSEQVLATVDGIRKARACDIVIVDYGMANLRSVQKAFERVGYAATVSGDPDRVGSADKVVLPGVGAFRDAIARLRESGLVAPLLDHLRGGKPFFGICLGLQLLFTTDHEDGTWNGLNFFSGDVVRFGHVPGLKVPHMGWNQLRVVRPAPPLAGFPDGGSVYFVHSYYVVPRDETIVAATADYPTPFAAAIWRDNVFATQFHPEKSQAIGLEMLRRFAEWK